MFFSIKENVLLHSKTTLLRYLQSNSALHVFDDLNSGTNRS